MYNLRAYTVNPSEYRLLLIATNFGPFLLSIFNKVTVIPLGKKVDLSGMIYLKSIIEAIK